MNCSEANVKSFSGRWILGAFMLLALSVIGAPRCAGQTSCTPLIPDAAFSPVLDINGTTVTTVAGGTGGTGTYSQQETIQSPFTVASFVFGDATTDFFSSCNGSFKAGAKTLTTAADNFNQQYTVTFSASGTVDIEVILDNILPICACTLDQLHIDQTWHYNIPTAAFTIARKAHRHTIATDQASGAVLDTLADDSESISGNWPISGALRLEITLEKTTALPGKVSQTGDDTFTATFKASDSSNSPVSGFRVHASVFAFDMTVGGHQHPNIFSAPGGHLGDENGNTADTCTTDGSGECVLFVVPSEASGKYRVLGIGVADSSVEAHQDFTVQVTGMTTLSSGRQTGSRPEHPDNHYGTATLDSNIAAVAADYEKKRHATIGINDMSLSLGGFST